jgi:hypothetical protein
MAWSNTVHEWKDHPIRDKILELQAAGDDVAAMPLDELAAALGDDSLPKVSYHRTVLKERGLLS